MSENNICSNDQAGVINPAFSKCPEDGESLRIKQNVADASIGGSEKDEQSESSDIDKGWAWVILFAGFINFFLCGILYVSGVFNVLFLEEYGQSKADTSWTSGLAIGLFSLAAPLGSIITSCAGPRITIIIGGILISSGYSLTYFSTSLMYVIITFGVMPGTGCALIYYASLVTIGFYFKRYRNLSYGISLTGIGIGVMVYPILLDYLFEVFGMRGTLLIMGALQLNSFVAAALTRPVSSKHLQQLFANESSELTLTVHVDGNKSPINNSDMNGLENSPVNKLNIKGLNNETDNKSFENKSNLHEFNNSSVNKSNMKDLNNNVDSSFVKKLNTKSMNRETDRSLVNKSDITNLNHEAGNSTDMNGFRNDTSSPESSVAKFGTKQNEFLNSNCNNKYPNWSAWKIKIKHLVISIKEFFVFRFIIFCFNLLFTGMAMYSIYVHFPAYAQSAGISSHFTTKLLTVMGVGSLLCRVVVGVGTNGSEGKTLAAYIASCFASGLTCFIGPYLCRHYIGQIAFALMFSFFANIYIGLMSPVVIDLMGVSKSVVTTGITLLMIGIGAVGGAPLLGHIVDMTGSYDHIFTFNGISFVIGGTIMLAIPLQKKLKAAKCCL